MPQFPYLLSPAAPTYHPQPVSSPDTHDHLPVGDETQIDAEIETILHGERPDKARQASTSSFATFREKMATLETDIVSLPDGEFKADFQKAHSELKDSVQQLRTAIFMLKRSSHYSDLVSVLHKHADLQDQFKALAETAEQHADAQKPDVRRIVGKVLLGIVWAAGCVASAIFLGPMAPAGWAGVTAAAAVTASLLGFGPMLSAFKDFRTPSGAHSKFQKDEFVGFRNEVFNSLSALIKKTLTSDNLNAAIQESMQAGVSHGPTPLTEFIHLVSHFHMSDSQREKLMDDVKNSWSTEEKRVLADAISHSSLPRGAVKEMLGKLIPPIKSIAYNALASEAKAFEVPLTEKVTRTYLATLALRREISAAESNTNPQSNSDKGIKLPEFYPLTKKRAGDLSLPPEYHGLDSNEILAVSEANAVTRASAVDGELLRTSLNSRTTREGEGSEREVEIVSLEYNRVNRQAERYNWNPNDSIAHQSPDSEWDYSVPLRDDGFGLREGQLNYKRGRELDLERDTSTSVRHSTAKLEEQIGSGKSTIRKEDRQVHFAKEVDVRGGVEEGVEGDREKREGFVRANIWRQPSPSS
ncbi:hypothetical protein [Cupriavidus pampae]|uniref:Uncharacterized protein n=1 Tax=Cupriavidus pampae TaxID=659251 RepID=A0ABN7ZSG5_9BURK|nr:hypothetical protein [Cupriavidus pampae]CAG9186986.1 hypothetical protein LMG32289_06724 [Cupriavidus pampae]